MLETPNPSTKHVRRWTKVYGSGVRKIKIFYRPGKESMNADALSRNPLEESPAVFQPDEVQVAVIKATQPATDLDIHSLLTRDPLSINGTSAAPANEFVLSQQQDPELWEII